MEDLLDNQIAAQAYSDPGYAIAYALLRLTDAHEALAAEVQDLRTTLGAGMERLAVAILDQPLVDPSLGTGLKDINRGLDEIAAAIIDSSP